jgi:hypothetical protein
MRRLLGGLAVLALLGTLGGCYRGRGICDCLDYRDPCCYGPYSLYGPPMAHDVGIAPAPGAEPLKVMPKEVEPEKKDEGKETAAPDVPQ